MSATEPSHRIPWTAPHRRLAVILTSLSLCLTPGSVSAAVITTWDPFAAGILNQFGTFALAVEETTSDFAADPASGFSASFNGEPFQRQLYQEPNLLGIGDARAVASETEFSVGAYTLNDRHADTSPFGPVAAGAAVATNFYIPALSTLAVLDPAVVLFEVHLGGFFEMDGGPESFAYLDAKVNGATKTAVYIFDFTIGSQTIVQHFDLLGNFIREEAIGPWSGGLVVQFNVDADKNEDTIGRLDLRLWVESQPKSAPDSIGSLAGFVETATVTAEPPPGAFVGLATGLAFLPDRAVALPAPGSFALFALGLAALGLGRRRPSREIGPSGNGARRLTPAPSAARARRGRALPGRRSARRRPRPARR